MVLVLCYFPWGKEDIYLDYISPEIASVFWLMYRSDKMKAQMHRAAAVLSRGAEEIQGCL